MSTAPLDLEAVKRVIVHHSMLKSGDGVVAAVSGGCDSSVLLHVLWKLSTEMDLKIICAHVNHNLRGEESRRDEAFVRSICEKYGIECRVLSANVAEFAEKEGLSTEEAGRKLRYEFFEHCADELGKNAKIATAHSLSDCAETYIFNSARGASLSGICGIPPVRGRIIRPLIEFSREQIESYANEHGLDYVTDSTNLTDEYTRNKIRHGVIPVMKEINPGFEKAFLRLSKNLAEARDFIDCEAEKLLESAKTKEGFDGGIIEKAHPALKNRAAAMILESFGFAFDNERTIRLAERFGGKDFKEELSKNEYLVQKNKIVFSERKAEPAERIAKTEFSPGKILLSKEKSLEISLLSYGEFKNSYKINSYVLKDTFDYDSIIGKAVIRSREEGDKADIHGGTKTLKKLFIEEKIPAEKRNSVAVIADDEGVIWVEGLGAAKRARLSEKTVNVAAMKIRHEINDL
ncbi:MAG: tRNA lysidine(34) synthetase TilS [Oscillospiraceae bacterium]|nr:tRNA lysidine(34) synthetase TilS [Oscillospiraceae bacterium]